MLDDLSNIQRRQAAIAYVIAIVVALFTGFYVRIYEPHGGESLANTLVDRLFQEFFSIVRDVAVIFIGLALTGDIARRRKRGAVEKDSAPGDSPEVIATVADHNTAPANAKSNNRRGGDGNPLSMISPKQLLVRALMYGALAIICAFVLWRILGAAASPEKPLDAASEVGVVLSGITLFLVAFQIDGAFRIAQAQGNLMLGQTHIAERQTEILERQDREMRALPDLALQFVGTPDPTFSMTGTRPEFANRDHKIQIRLAIANFGAVAHGATIELRIPNGVSIPAEPGGMWENRGSTYTGDALLFTKFRAELAAMVFYGGEPTELTPTDFTFDWVPISVETPSSEFPVGYRIEYRIISGGRPYPSTGYSEIRILPMTIVTA